MKSKLLIFLLVINCFEVFVPKKAEAGVHGTILPSDAAFDGVVSTAAIVGVGLVIAIASLIYRNWKANAPKRYAQMLAKQNLEKALGKKLNADIVNDVIAAAYNLAAQAKENNENFDSQQMMQVLSETDEVEAYKDLVSMRIAEEGPSWALRNVNFLLGKIEDVDPRITKTILNIAMQTVEEEISSDPNNLKFIQAKEFYQRGLDQLSGESTPIEILSSDNPIPSSAQTLGEGEVYSNLPPLNIDGQDRKIEDIRALNFKGTLLEGSPIVIIENQIYFLSPQEHSMLLSMNKARGYSLIDDPDSFFAIYLKTSHDFFGNRNKDTFITKIEMAKQLFLEMPTNEAIEPNDIIFALNAAVNDFVILENGSFFKLSNLTLPVFAEESNWSNVPIALNSNNEPIKLTANEYKYLKIAAKASGKGAVKMVTNDIKFTKAVFRLTVSTPESEAFVVTTFKAQDDGLVPRSNVQDVVQGSKGLEIITQAEATEDGFGFEDGDGE